MKRGKRGKRGWRWRSVPSRRAGMSRGGVRGREGEEREGIRKDFRKDFRKDG